MANPFNYLQFATGDQFYDRREVRKDLFSRFLSGQSNVVLYGPRRYGKSSLVAELVGDLEKAGIPCVTLDVVKVPSIDMFVSAYATKVYRRLAPVKFEFRKLGMFLKSLRPKMSLGPTGETGLSFEPSGATVGPEALTEVLDLPQKLLSGRGRAVVVFDEFQEVKDLLPNDGFERVMRSAIQSHRNVSYIFLGSRYHMLRRMFTDHNRPFYKSAVTILLGKPPVERGRPPSGLSQKLKTFPTSSSNLASRPSGLSTTRTGSPFRRPMSIPPSPTFPVSTATSTSS